MNAPMVQRPYLDSADRHITETEGLIFRQQELIQRLSASGQDTASAARFLGLLEQTLERFRAHRDLVASHAPDGQISK